MRNSLEGPRVQVGKKETKRWLYITVYVFPMLVFQWRIEIRYPVADMVSLISICGKCFIELAAQRSGCMEDPSP